MYSFRDDNGFEFITGEQHTYLVTYTFDGSTYAVIDTSREIFKTMDMSDCSDIEIVEIRLIREYKSIKDFEKYGYPKCKFFGKWCCDNPETGRIDPLRMEIRLETGEILDVAYGDEH